MYDKFDITIENYMKMLESVGDHIENRVSARFAYLETDSGCDGWALNIDPSQIFTIVTNLKVRFENNGSPVKTHIAMSRQRSDADRDALLSACRKCVSGEGKPSPTMEPWIVLYEWYTRQCLAIRIEDIVVKKASCVITSKNVWLMDQATSVSEMAMQNVWDRVRGSIVD
jgi:hypothetical protein